AAAAPRSVAFVSLGSLRDPDAVARTINEALDTTVLPPYAPGDQSARLLLVDNFEHLLVAADALGSLLEQAPDLQLLVTSREILHLYGEHEYLVPPLDLPPFWRLPALAEFGQIPAVQLFAT